MAMLAESRQRKRYNLMPKGKALYEDESRFGTKMLEKMGWKKGEGLGASSDGSKDFVRIRYKNDAFGLGFEQRDDQWTQHEQSFNGLLKTLNNEENDEQCNKEAVSVNDYEDEMPSRVGFGFQDASAKEVRKSKSGKMKEKISGISLEEKSKQSKARVHYKKFTKGKDLAQYSEKDLANIFGKKAVDEQPVNDFYKNLSQTFGIINEEANSDQMNGKVNGLEDSSEDSASKKRDKKRRKKEKNMELEKEEKQNIPVQTFTSNLSVQDYFKLKMEAIKNKKSGHNEEGLADINPACQDQPKAELKKKSKKNKEVQALPDNCIEEPSEKKTKKRKKNRDLEDSRENEFEKGVEVCEKKNKKLNMEETEETILQETKCDSKCLVDDHLTGSGKKKTKKIKNKTDKENLAENEVPCLDQEDVQELTEKKSKKNKNLSEQNEPQIIKKAKKSKSREIAETAEFKIKDLREDTLDEATIFENGVVHDAENILLETKSKKKKDKSKHKVEDELSSESKTAKKRKVEEQETVIAGTADSIGAEADLVQDSAGKKKKKNKKERTEVIEVIDSDSDKHKATYDNEIQPIVKEKKEKKKSKESKIPAEETSAPEEASTVSKLTNSTEAHPAKVSTKEVSSNAINISGTADNVQEIDLEDLKTKYQAFNKYRISSFSAEKFRNVNLSDFKNSTLSQIEGYGLSSDIQLDIYVKKNDEQRIIDFWKTALNTNQQIDKPKKTYKKYVQMGIQARKAKQKAPKLYIKTWQRKNAFQL